MPVDEKRGGKDEGGRKKDECDGITVSSKDDE
jgi:hypothetical protein